MRQVVTRGLRFGAALLFLVCLSAFGQCNATTANIALNVPPNGCNNGTWDVPYNANWNAIDSYLSGGSTSPFFKAQSIAVLGLTTGRCVRVGASGILGVAALDCNQVASVYGRTGAVTAQSGDYNIGQITGITFSGAQTTNLVTFSSITGAAGALFCKGAAGDLTTASCPAAAGGASLSPAGAQAFVMNNGFSLGVNVLEDIAFAADNAPSSSGGINETFTNNCRNGGKCHVFAGLGTIAACNIAIPTNGVLSGMGWTLTVLQCATAGAPVIASAGDKAIIEEVTLQHSSSPSTGGDGLITVGDRVTIRHVRAINNQVGLRLGTNTFGEIRSVISEQNNSDCLLFDTTLGSPGPTTAPMQWVIYGGLLQKCGGWGANMVNAGTIKWTGPRFVGGTHFFGNHLGGAQFQNTSSGRIDNTFINANYFSQNDGDNIFMDANGHNIAIENNYIEQSGGNLATGVQSLWGFNAASGTGTPTGAGHGVDLTANCDATGTPPLVKGNRFFQTADDAVMSLCPYTHVSGNEIYDAGFGHTSGAANLRAGIAVEASFMVVHDNHCTQGGTHSLSCIDLSNSADKPDLAGNNCGTGYTDGTCYSETTFPSNGLRTWVGITLFIQSQSAPSLSAGQCSGLNGSFWQRVDSTGGLWYCVNGAWIAK